MHQSRTKCVRLKHERRMKSEAVEGEEKKKPHYYSSPLNEGKPTDGKTIQGNEWWSRLNSNC